MDAQRRQGADRLLHAVRPLVRVLAALVAVAALFAGCGGGGEEAPQPVLGGALGYLPAEPVRGALIKGDRAALELAAALPVLGRRVEELGLEDRRIRSAASGTIALGDDGGDLVAAVPVRESQQATALAAQVPTAAAADGDVLVLGSSRRAVDRAVARAAAGDGAGDDDVAELGGGLPTSRAAVVAFGAGEAPAGGTPWLAAATGFAATVSREDGAISADLRIDTSGEQLAEEDLPLATGRRPPEVPLGRAGLQIALREPARTLEWAQELARALDPNGARSVRRAKAGLRRLARVDLDADVLDRLTGDGVLQDFGGGVGFRARVRDSEVVRRAMQRAARFVPALLVGAGGPELELGGRSRGLTRLLRDGAPAGAFGVVGGQIVAGSIGPAALQAFGGAPTDVPFGAQGPLAIRVPERLARRLLRDRLGLSLPAGELTGWARNTPDHLRVHLQTAP